MKNKKYIEAIENKMIEINSYSSSFYMTDNLNKFIEEEDYTYFEEIRERLADCEYLFSKILKNNRE